MKSGNINFIDTELTNEQFTSLGYPALYILKNSSNTVTKFIIFDLNGVRTDYDTSSGGGSGVTEEWVNSQISTAISNLQDNRLEFNEFSDFPAIGDETKFYIDLTEDKIYIWDVTSSTYKNQSWDTAIIASIQASIASAQMAFQNLENSKLDKPSTDGTFLVKKAGGTISYEAFPGGGVTKTTFTHDILVANWSLVGGKYEAVISNVGILADSFVDIIPSNDNVEIVRNAQIFPSVLVSAGSVKVYSKFLPSGTISVTVNVI